MEFIDVLYFFIVIIGMRFYINRLIADFSPCFPELTAKNTIKFITFFIICTIILAIIKEV